MAERAWIRGAQRGSVSDLEALFREHWSRAYRAAYLVVHDAAAAEDIAQEAFLAAVRASTASTGGARSGRGCTGSPSTARSTGRAPRSCAPRPRSRTSPRPSAPEPDDRMLPALASLDPDHRAVIVLRYLLEYTPGEIADLLDLPRGTVNSRLRRGLDKLKERLE